MAIESNKPARRRRFQWISLVALVCGLIGMAGAVHAGYAAVVVDASSGQVLDAVNPDQPNYPASLTKMMTLYLTFQGLEHGRLKLDQKMPVSSTAANKAPTKLGLRRGQTISVKDCILGMVTKSANDAATVMAEGLGGSEHHFADMMNAQAALLGMSDTHFANASGLPDPKNISTARDLVKLAMALYRDFPAYSPYFATQEFTFRGRLVRGHNHLMDRYPGMDGLKTGFTDASGFNLASTAARNGQRLFAVVLGSRTAAVRDSLMAKLLNNGFEQRPTPPSLVAEAAGVRSGSRAARILAALSPIQTAAADTIPVAPHQHGHRTVSHRRHARGVAAARNTCSAHQRTACRRVVARHAVHRAPRLAGHSVKKPMVAATRREPADKAP